MLAGIEHGNENVQVREQFAQRSRLADRHRKVRTVAPIGIAFVERIPNDFDFVTQRLEHRSQDTFAAAYGEHIEVRGQWYRRVDQLGAVFATALKCRAVDLCNRHAEKRRGHVGSVVHVLREQEVLIGVLTANHAHRIDIEKQTSRTAIRTHFGVIDVRLAETEFERLEPIRVFVQQIPEVVCRGVSRRDRQEHVSLASIARSNFSNDTDKLRGFVRERESSGSVNEKKRRKVLSLRRLQEPPQGFEPWTPALRKPCSTAELRRPISSGRKDTLTRENDKSNPGKVHIRTTIFPASVPALPRVLSSCKRCAAAASISGNSRAIGVRSLPDTSQ